MVSKDGSDRITVSFPYDPQLVEKVKTIEGRKWHLFMPVIARRPEQREGTPKQSQFEDLRRELVSRKYSYKTVKGYLYYNRDFVSFIGKDPSGITEEDIKDYLLYLVEEKQSATSNLDLKKGGNN